MVDRRRREFITILGSAATWPLAVGAQGPATPVIGFLNTGSADAYPDRLVAFHAGLNELGFVEGRNVTVEYRWALGQYDRLAAMAGELVRQPISVLVAAGGEPAALAAKAATSTVPIVFAVGGDPVKLGLVKSYNRPGGNATGANILAATLEAKRLGLLREIVPQAGAIGVLLDPRFPSYESQLSDVQEAARANRLPLLALLADTDQEIEAAFETATRQRIGALAVAAAPFFDTRRDKLVALAARHSLPTMFQFREFARAGGLMSYGVYIADIYRQVGVYTGRILKGEKSADLPVVQPTRFELVLNLKTAKTLGIEFPRTLLATADEVIE
jgi:putative ABC transport system substrate-binding protein